MNTNLTNKKIKNFLPILFLLLIVVVPVFANAQGPKEIVPSNCGKVGQPECGFSDLMQLVNNIITWIIWISVPVAAGVFAWAGILYMTTGVSDKKSKAKEMLQKVAIGFVCILAAWIIVTTITNTLLSDTTGIKQSIPIEGVK